jgi:hypothetical protein
MSCCTDCDECATEKTEAKEFAYFSGLLTGRKNERERILEKLMEKVCDCRFGYPDELRTYYKTSGRETRESDQAYSDWQQAHMYHGDIWWKTIVEIITGKKPE